MIVYEFHDVFYENLPQARHAAIADFRNEYPMSFAHCTVTEKILPIDRYVSRYQLIFAVKETRKTKYRKRSIIIHETTGLEGLTGIDLENFS
jgi:hypothetical protein